MFWKKIKAPATEEDIAWVDETIAYIRDENFFTAPYQVVSSSDILSKHQFSGKEQDAEFLLSYIGDCYDLDTSEINLFFYSEEEGLVDQNILLQPTNKGKGTAGKYVQSNESISIQIEARQLLNTDKLIATIAHELSHFELLHIKGFELRGEMNEYFTDLYTICRGFGLFMGNAKHSFEQWQNGDGWGGWSMSNQGYLPLQVIAYAIAKLDHLDSAPNIDKNEFRSKEFYKYYQRSIKYLNAQ